MNVISVLLKLEIMMPFMLLPECPRYALAIIAAVCCVLNEAAEDNCLRLTTTRAKTMCLLRWLGPVILAYAVVLAVAGSTLLRTTPNGVHIDSSKLGLLGAILLAVLAFLVLVRCIGAGADHLFAKRAEKRTNE